MSDLIIILAMFGSMVAYARHYVNVQARKQRLASLADDPEFWDHAVNKDGWFGI